MLFGIRTTAKDSLILTEPKKTVKHLINLCLYPANLMNRRVYALLPITAYSDFSGPTNSAMGLYTLRRERYAMKTSTRNSPAYLGLGLQNK